MKIYHGTSSENRESIEKDGLAPRGDKPGNWEGNPSCPTQVYLTNTYPLFFCSCLCNSHTDWMICEVDTDLLDQESLWPDEDYISQLSRHYARQPRNSVGGKNKPTSTASYAKMIEQDDVLFQPLWRMSLNELGTISHRGVIPPGAIKIAPLLTTEYESILTMPAWMRTYMMASLDPCITISNQAILGDWHRHVTQVLLGNEEPEENARERFMECAFS